MKKIFKDKPLFISIAFTILCLLTYVYDHICRDGIYAFRTIVVIISIWAFYIVYINSFLKKSLISFYIVESFIFASVYMGRVMMLYKMWGPYDKVLHLTSGVVIAILGYVYYLSLVDNSKRESVSPYLGIIFSILFAATGAGVWEIWEFSTDVIFGFTAQNNSLNDTMLDIICGTVMGLVTNIPFIMHVKGVKIKFIDRLIEEMN